VSNDEKSYVIILILNHVTFFIITHLFIQRVFQITWQKGSDLTKNIMADIMTTCQSALALNFNSN